MIETIDENLVNKCIRFPKNTKKEVFYRKILKEFKYRGVDTFMLDFDIITKVIKKYNKDLFIDFADNIAMLNINKPKNLKEISMKEFLKKNVNKIKNENIEIDEICEIDIKVLIKRKNEDEWDEVNLEDVVRDEYKNRVKVEAYNPLYITLVPENCKKDNKKEKYYEIKYYAVLEDKKMKRISDFRIKKKKVQYELKTKTTKNSQ